MAKKPDDLQQLVNKIEDQAPRNAAPAFQNNLRQKLLLKHTAMTKSNEPEKAIKKEMVPEKSAQNGDDGRGGRVGFNFFGMKGLSFAVALLLIVVVAGVVGYPAIPAPTVSGYELKGAVRKISYNAPIKIVFNQMMDNGSVEKSFKIEILGDTNTQPKNGNAQGINGNDQIFTGHFDWSFNTLNFYPDQQFKVGDTYKVSVGKSAKSLFQKNLPYDYEEDFQIVAAPKVLLFSPAPDSENMGTDKKITVMFDRPMTGLTSLDAGETQFPQINIEPKAEGKFKWLGTDTVTFIPTKLTYATKYTVTVPKGTKSNEGGATDQDFSFSFTTLKPALLVAQPSDLNRYNGPKTKIKLDFNQPMNLDAVQKNIHLYKALKKVNFGGGQSQLTNFDTSAWQTVGFDGRYLTMNDIKTDPTIGNPQAYTGEAPVNPNSQEVSNDELQKTLILIPNAEFDYDSIYFLKIDKEFGGTEGTYALGTDWGILFKTVGDISINSTAPADNEDLSKANKDERQSYPLSMARIIFSQPMSLDSMQEKVSISPANIDKDTKQEEKPTLSLEGDGYITDNQLQINYGFKPSTKYTITLKAGSKDQFGKSYDKDFSFSFKTAPLAPDFNLATGSDISIVDSNKPKVYYLKSTNLDFVNLKFKKVSDEEFKKIYNNGYVNSKELQNLQGPFVLFDKKITNVFNSQVVTKLDLAKELGQDLLPGIYYLDAQNPQVLDYYKKPIVDKQIFIVSGSGLAVKQSDGQMLVWATSLKDGSPIEGMNIELRYVSGETAFTGTTDKDGLVTLNILTNSYDDYTIIGRKDADFTIANSSWQDGISPWNFNIASNFSPSTYYIYSYTDRPIYRPGHDVYFKGLVRKDLDATFKLPEVKQVHVVVNDSQGEKVYEKDLDLNANGTFNGQLKLSEQARTGTYSIDSSLVSESSPQAKGVYNSTSTTFRIAEYRKPDYELNLATDKTDYVNGEKASIKVKGSYYFGAPMPSADIEWTLNTQDYYFFLNPDLQSPYSGQWYSFSDEGYSCMWGCTGGNTVVATGKAKLDANGEYTIELPLDITAKKLSQIYTLEVTAKDLNNQTVSNRVNMPVHAGQYYLGILNQDYVVKKGDPAKFQIISVDSNGGAVGGKAVEVSFFKRTWNTVKKKNVDSNYYYENNYDDVLVEKKSVTTNEKGYAEVEFTAKDGGDFKATATGTDSLGNKILASTSVFVSSYDFVNWGRENNDRIELVPDKAEYKPGDTANILIKSPYQNVWALVTEERKNVISKKIIKIKSNSETITVPITEKSIPNLFVSVVLVKGDNATAGLGEPADGANDERSVAAFKIGYTTLQVDTSSRKLLMDVQPEKPNYKPGDEVTLHVKTTDVNGKPRAAEISVAVVDKSVLSLTESVTTDLLQAFYSKRFLGVQTALTLTKALSRVNVQVEAGLKGGGGGDLKKRGTFKDTAYWQAVVNTDASGNGTVKFKVPDNLTTWEVLTIGITKDTLVGSNKSEFIVNKDVLVRPILPRFLIVDDTMKVGAIVHNYLDKETRFNVNLDAKGVQLLGPYRGPQGVDLLSISLKPGEEKKVEWDAKVLNEKEATLVFEVHSQDDNSIGDILEQKLPIHPYSFPEVVATSSAITDGAKHPEQVWLPFGIDKNLGELTITVAPTLASSISQGLEYLMRFPYGCTEQTASSLLPNLVIKQVLNLPALSNAKIDQKQLQKNVEAGLQALYKYQQPSGGWGIWQTSETTPYLTTYVLYTLFQAKQAGYTVDENVMTNGRTYLTNYINSHSLQNPGTNTLDLNLKSNLHYEANMRAYAVYVLAEIGFGDVGLTNNLYGFKDYLNIFGKAYLVMAFNDLKKDATGSLATDFNGKIESLKNDVLNKAKETVRGIHFEESEHEYRLFDTDTRTTALVLQMLARVSPDHPYLPKIMRFIMNENKAPKDGRYISTQETAVTLLAMVDYLKSSNELEPNYAGTVTVNGVSKLQKSYTQKNIGDKDTVVVALKDLLLDNQDNEIVATRSGVGKMYFDMTLRYFLPTEKIKPRDEGMVVSQEYFNVEDTKFEHPVKSVTVGQNMKGRITVVVPEDRYYVMVEDYLPAGLEAIDFTLNNTQQGLLNNLQNQLGDGKGMAAYGYESGYYGDGKGGYNGGWYFNYSEIRDDRVMYFADFLPKGVYEIDYFVRATTPGVYHDLPVLGQELYFPEVFGRSEGAMFEVKE